MGYYERADLPYYYALADAFTICDGYHCSVMGPTHPNRLMAVSGTLDPDGRHGGPILLTTGDPAKRFSLDWPTMPEVLEDAGVSWKVYNPPGELYSVTHPEVLNLTDSVLAFFRQYSDPTTPIHQKAFNPTFPTEFALDVAAGTLPAVSWIIPPAGYDEHPPSPPNLGEAFTDQVLRALVANPEVWSKTVFFHMYDENDGFFDHVAPPVAPPGTPGEYVTVDPLPDVASGIAGPIGLGYRVPMLVISPFSRGGRVSSETFDHTSQLRFLEERFGVRAPNISAWRRKTVGDLTATLDLSSPIVPLPPLPSVIKDTKTVLRTMGCDTANFIEATTAKLPRLPIPTRQRMPTQEPGKPRRVPGSRAAISGPT
jgi:phospholipase C